MALGNDCAVCAPSLGLTATPVGPRASLCPQQQTCDPRDVKMTVGVHMLKRDNFNLHLESDGSVRWLATPAMLWGVQKNASKLSPHRILGTQHKRIALRGMFEAGHWRFAADQLLLTKLWFAHFINLEDTHTHTPSTSLWSLKSCMKNDPAFVS